MPRGYFFDGRAERERSRTHCAAVSVRRLRVTFSLFEKGKRGKPGQFIPKKVKSVVTNCTEITSIPMTGPQNTNGSCKVSANEEP